ncbi:TPA: hypothetical protein ACH3X1_005010 [Trebouxia sp. C0004]
MGLLESSTLWMDWLTTCWLPCPTLQPISRRNCGSYPSGRCRRRSYGLLKHMLRGSLTSPDMALMTSARHKLRCQHLATHTLTSGAALATEAVAMPTPASITTNSRGGGRGPFSASRGSIAQGRGTRGRGGGRGRGSPLGRSSQPVYDENLHCSTCNAIGHAKWLCPTANCEVLPDSVSYAVVAINDTPLPGPPSLAHQYAHQCVSSCDDSHAALHSIGTTAIPLGVRPDPADDNADPAATSGRSCTRAGAAHPHTPHRVIPPAHPVFTRSTG